MRTPLKAKTSTQINTLGNSPVAFHTRSKAKRANNAVQPGPAALPNKQVELSTVFAKVVHITQKGESQSQSPVKKSLKTKNKEKQQEESSVWLSICDDNVAGKRTSKMSDAEYYHIVDSLRGPGYQVYSDPQAHLLVKPELDRLANLMIDDEATITDIAHYIIFSYAIPEFDPCKFGRAKAGSLHVCKPPILRTWTLYAELINASSPELQTIGMITFYHLIRDRADVASAGLRVNSSTASAFASLPIQARESNTSLQFYYGCWLPSGCSKWIKS